MSLLTEPVFAQRFTASIRGTVTDASGAAIAGANVVLKNEQTGLTRAMTTNAAGNYSFADLPVGSYQLEVSFTGLKSFVQTRIGVGPADVREVNVRLAIGEMAETINVEAGLQAVKTVGAEIAGVVSGDQVAELPLNGRNFLQLTLLQPGVTPVEGLNTVNKGLLGGADLSVSGGSTTSNLWLVDGADNVDHGSNRTILVYPSIDAIEEFKIQRNNYGAEFGQAGGAQVNLVTKSGNNTYHGSGYYFARRDSWNATDYFLKAAALPKAPLHWDDFGGTVGGPVVKDKLHFFLSYEHNKDSRSEVRTGFVPTGFEKAGNFSGAPLAGCTPPVPVDPLTGQPFPGNVIPADRISPAGQALSKLYQLPNHTPSSGCDNYIKAAPAPVTWWEISARMDWTVNSRTRLMVRYTQDSWKAANSDRILDPPWSVVASDLNQPSRVLVAQLNRTFGSNQANTLTFSYSANTITGSRTGDTAVVDEVNSLLPTFFPSSVKERGGEAQPFFVGAGPYGLLASFSPWENNQSLYAFKDDWSAVFGRHFVRAGAFYSQNAKNEEPAPASVESVLFGGFFGGGFVTAAGYVPGLTTGNPIADILLEGTVYNTRELKTNKSVQARWRDLELYAADSYKLTPRVTADVGVRVSHLEPPWMADHAQGNFVLSTVNPALGNSSCNGMEYPPGENPCPGVGLEGGTEAANRSLVPIKFLWVAPRLGVAWDVSGNGKTAVRGGVGLFYQRERVNVGLDLGVNPPFSGHAAVTRTLDSATPVVGEAAPGYGAPGEAVETKAGNVHYWQWNVAVEREIVRNTVVEVAYVGSRGLGLLGQTNLNEVAPPNRLAYAQTGAAALRPLDGLTGIGNSDLPLWQHDRNSIYHGLQVAATSRFGHGSVLAVAYTWSKLIATGAVDASGGGVLDQASAYTDSTQPSLDRSRGGTDRTHMFNASLVLALPRLQASSPFVRNVLGDWEFTTIVQAASGYPVTVTASVPGLNGQAGTGGAQQRPDRVTGQPCSVRGASPTQWLNPAAFTLDGYRIGTNGTAGRNVCDGPGSFQTDASLYKNIRVASRLKLQLRFEVFNVFNTVSFLGNSLNTGYNVQNVVFDTGSPATATRILSATPPGTFGQLTAARDPRIIQLGVRLTF